MELSLEDKIKIFSFVTKMLKLHHESVDECKGRQDYYNLIIASLMFIKLAEVHFKDDYEKTYDSSSSDDKLSFLNDIAVKLVDEFLKDHANKVLN